MFYGIGMPIMFPMAAIILANQRLCQRIRVAWICQQPPLLGNELNERVISILKLAPLFMMFNSYWIVDNHQIFRNAWFYLDRYDVPMKSGHYFYHFDLCQSSPLFYTLFVLSVVIVAKKVVPHDIMIKFGFGMYKKIDNIIEDLPKFKDAI